MTARPPEGGGAGMTSAELAVVCAALVAFADRRWRELAAHLAAACRSHRATQRQLALAVPTSFHALEAVLLEFAGTVPRGDTEGHPMPDVCPNRDPRERANVPVDEILIRGYARAAIRAGCSPRTLKRRVAAGLIEPIRNGRVLRFRADDLDRLQTQPGDS